MNTGLSAFDTTLQKTNEMLEEIEDELGWKDRRAQSYHALRATLHALRDRLNIEEATQLGAQLPMLVRGFYYDGWNPAGTPQKMDKDEFIEKIRQGFYFQLGGGQTIEDVTRTVIKVLKKRLDKQEIDQAISLLPKDVQKTLQ